MKHLLFIFAVLIAFFAGLAIQPKVIQSPITALFPVDHYWPMLGTFYRMSNDTMEHSRINAIENDVITAENQLCQLGQSNSCRWVNGVQNSKREKH
jgi:hypothetical protein